MTIDDEERGVTPLTVRVSPGTHVLQLRVGTAEPRVIPLMIRAGVQTAQYVELQGVSSTGVLEVRSEPSAARVTIDGQARGSTPLDAARRDPGRLPGGARARRLEVDPGRAGGAGQRPLNCWCRSGKLRARSMPLAVG